MIEIEDPQAKITPPTPGGVMTDIRISGLSRLTSDAIGACAYITARHGIDRTPANPDMATAQRLTILTDAFAKVTSDAESAEPGVLERSLLNLAGLAGLWVDGMTAVPAAQEPEQKPRKLIRVRQASDPGIDFSGEDD